LKPTQCIFLKGNPEIRALDINPEDGKVFAAAFESGDIFHYEGLVPFDPKTPLKLVEICAIGQPKTRSLKYWKSRNEVVVGCEMGRFSVYQVPHFQNGPIRKLPQIANV
jgi:hypothetical protein